MARSERGPRISTIARGLVLLALAAPCAGCIGPQAVRQTRIRYNEAYRATNDEQILLNIVRLRYADSPVFVDLPNITSQFEVTGRGSYSGGLDGQGPGRTNLGIGEIFYRDAPTLSYHPRTGREIARNLASPLTVEALRLVVGTAGPEPFLLMAVNDINDLPNAPGATAMIPDAPGDNAEFREVLGLLAVLRQRGAIELGIDTVEAEAADPIPADNVQGWHLLEAAKGGYTFRSQGPDRMALKKRQKNLALKVRPRDRHSPEMIELARRLRVAPGLDVYRLRSELYEDDEEDLPSLPNPLGEDTVLLNMRSVLEILAFLGKGVCVPAGHAAAGIAPTLCDVDGRPYDWTHVTAGLFFVHSGKHRPKHAEVAVRYRGYWFWIAGDDVASRATLADVELLLSLQESGEEEAGPLLTLPVGN